MMAKLPRLPLDAGSGAGKMATWRMQREVAGLSTEVMPDGAVTSVPPARTRNGLCGEPGGQAGEQEWSASCTRKLRPLALT